MIRRMPRPSAHQHIAIAALTVDLTAGGNAPTEFRLVPLGRFKAADGSGRPDGLPDGWLLTRQRADEIVAWLNARANHFLVDYEHQTIKGGEAPASGWGRKFEVRDGDMPGIWSVGFEWTARAAAMIATKEYRYISPFFSYDKRTGEVLALRHAGLTNDPGLDGLTDLAGAAALTALFMEDEPMKQLLAALGLSETASEAEALAALVALKTAHHGEVAALKGAAPDPTKYVEVAVLTGVRNELAVATAELASLKAEKLQAEVDAVIEAGLAAGKLTPATEPHARKLAGDLVALKGFIDAQPVIVKPGETQTGGKGGDGKSHQHTDTDLAVMKALGLNAEQFASGKPQEA